MRFTNEDVYYQLDSVLKKIEEVVLARLNMKARD
jgi:very-short-patch-repair endonuclease